MFFNIYNFFNQMPDSFCGENKLAVFRYLIAAGYAHLFRAMQVMLKS